jgi:TolB-like protein/DNA-binding winged helix-turn-helix (wHTH) protein
MHDAAGFDAVGPLREASPLLRFAALALNLDACVLAHESGPVIPLTRGEFALLRMFVTRSGRVISRDTLLDAFTNRRFEPFDRSIDVLVGRLRRKIEADPKKPRLIVTVPGEGYRFDGLTQSLPSGHKPSIAVRASPDHGGRPNERHGSNPPFAERSAAFGQAGGAKVAMSERREPPRLSIVVLPFANIGGDPEQDYFADGVTDSLTTGLSGIDGAFVIARSTAFSFKGKPFDVKEIGRELNIRYVMEGSVQRAANRIRLNVQLIDVESGSHLWAEQFDRLVADIFEMQDEIVVRLAGQLNATLILAEARRLRKSPNPDAFDLSLQGTASLIRGGPYPARLQQARSFFARALAIDPDDVRALCGCAAADISELFGFEVPDRLKVLAAAEASLSRALSLAPERADAHLWLSFVKSASNRPQEGVAEAERALALDRNMPLALAAKATAMLFLGFAEEAIDCQLQALRLSPRDDGAHAWMYGVGAAKLHLGEYDDAAKWFRQSIMANPNFSMAHFLLAAALGQLGRVRESRAEAEAGLTLNSTFTISSFRDGAESDNPIFLKQRTNVYEGLRLAGIPETTNPSLPLLCTRS